MDNNPVDQNAPGTPPVADPNAGQPVQDAPMGGSTYTPPAAPLGDQPTSEPVVPPAEETPAVPGEQNPGNQPTGGTPVV